MILILVKIFPNVYPWISTDFCHKYLKFRGDLRRFLLWKIKNNWYQSFGDFVYALKGPFVAIIKSSVPGVISYSVGGIVTGAEKICSKLPLPYLLHFSSTAFVCSAWWSRSVVRTVTALIKSESKFLNKKIIINIFITLTAYAHGGGYSCRPWRLYSGVGIFVIDILLEIQILGTGTVRRIYWYPGSVILSAVLKKLMARPVPVAE